MFMCRHIPISEEECEGGSTSPQHAPPCAAAQGNSQEQQLSSYCRQAGQRGHHQPQRRFTQLQTCQTDGSRQASTTANAVQPIQAQYSRGGHAPGLGGEEIKSHARLDGPFCLGRKYSRIMYRVRYTPELAAARKKRVMMKMVGYGEMHASTPHTTVRTREVSSVLDRPTLKTNNSEVRRKSIRASLSLPVRTEA